MRLPCVPALLLLLCCCCCCFAAVLQSDTEKPHPKCQKLCSVCESLHQAQVNRVCSVQLLGRCQCQEFALTSPGGGSGANSSAQHCPDAEDDSNDAFCPMGQLRDPASGCPTGRCRTPPKCPPLKCQRNEKEEEDSEGSSSSSSSRQWCPFGHRTDAAGCPTCDCACPDEKAAAQDCSSACARVGATAYRLVVPQQGACPVCACRGIGGTSAGLTRPCHRRCPSGCGPHGHRNASLDSHGCVTDCACSCPVAKDPSKCPAGCPVTWARDEFGCDECRCAAPHEPRWCPAPPICAAAKCGAGGFLVSPRTGCQESCDCACPLPRCPANCPKLRWGTDRRGCATCGCDVSCRHLRCKDCGHHGYVTDERGCATCDCKCPVEKDPCPGTTCERNVTDRYGCATCSVCVAPKPCDTRATANLSQICPPDCVNNLLVEHPDTKCLECRCTTDCPPEPLCLEGCGKYQRKRDSSGCVVGCDCECPTVTEETCRRGCKFNATIAKDVYGCPVCKCQKKQRCPAIQPPCRNNCGSHGYEADDNGCQASCRCNCPRRKCHCTFRLEDEFGCCSCGTLDEWLKSFVI